MGLPEIIAIAVTLSIIAWGLIAQRNHSRELETKNTASQIAKSVFPVWASLGPFSSGEESEVAMRAAYIAVFGEIKAMELGFLSSPGEHAAAYDKEPHAWEENRKLAMEHAGPETQRFADMANGIAAIENLNNTFRNSGYRMRFEHPSEGGRGIYREQVWTDEQIKAQEQELWESMATAAGVRLKGSPLQEADDLRSFLVKNCQAAFDKSEITDVEIGKAYLNLMTTSGDEAKNYFVYEFDRLYDKWIVADSNFSGDEIEKEMRWSKAPGAFEQHLRRRHQNLYFPEDKRIVTELELSEAKSKDDDGFAECKSAYDAIMKEFNGYDEHPLFFPFNEFREKIDSLIDRCLSVGGPAISLIAHLDELRCTVIDLWRLSQKGNHKFLESLEKAEVVASQRRANRSELREQLSRDDDPIPPDEMIPAMLSAHPNEIVSVLETLEDTKRAMIIMHCLEIISEARKDDRFEDPQLLEKIAVLNMDEYSN